MDLLQKNTKWLLNGATIRWTAVGERLFVKLADEHLAPAVAHRSLLARGNRSPKVALSIVSLAMLCYTTMV